MQVEAGAGPASHCGSSRHTEVVPAHRGGQLAGREATSWRVGRGEVGRRLLGKLCSWSFSTKKAVPLFLCLKQCSLSLGSLLGYPDTCSVTCALWASLSGVFQGLLSCSHPPQLLPPWTQLLGGWPVSYLPLYPQSLAPNQAHSGPCGSGFTAGKRNSRGHFRYKGELGACEIARKMEWAFSSMTLKRTPGAARQRGCYLEGREPGGHGSHPHSTCLRHPRK